MTNCSSSLAAGALAAILASSALAADPAVEPSIAVLTPLDLAGTEVPSDEIARALAEALEAEGFRVLPVERVDALLERHRFRYTGGASAEMAAAFGAEEAIEGILLTSVDDWEENEPPRVTLTCRWVGASPEAPILWMGGASHHGAEHPGALGLGIVTDVRTLLARAAREVASDLVDARDARDAGEPFTGEAGRSVPRRFRPMSLAAEPSMPSPPAGRDRLRVVVLPFVTEGTRRETGEIVGFQFVRHLAGRPGVEVVEPGVVREALLESRLIQDDGVSLAQADILRALLEADLVISGTVTDFESQGSGPGTPFLGFAARAIDTSTRQAVWTSFSFVKGDDGFRLFESGRIRSIGRIASELVRGVVETVDRKTSRGRGR